MMPISTFIRRSPLYGTQAIHILIALVCLTENSEDGLLSPAIRDGLVIDAHTGIEKNKAAKLFADLLLAGEVEWHETDVRRGFVVTRYNDLLDDMTLLGRRLYFKNQARKKREK